MTKQEYVEWFWDQDYRVLANLIDKVWNEACNKTVEELSKIITEYEKDTGFENTDLLYKLEEDIYDRKPKLS